MAERTWGFEEEDAGKLASPSSDSKCENAGLWFVYAMNLFFRDSLSISVHPPLLQRRECQCREDVRACRNERLQFGGGECVDANEEVRSGVGEKRDEAAAGEASFPCLIGFHPSVAGEDGLQLIL